MGAGLTKIRGLKKRKGLTLLELMVAAGILVVAITGLLAAFIGSFILNVSNNNRSIAAADAQYVLEQMLGVAYSGLGSYTPPSLTNLPDEAIDVTVTSSAGQRNLNVTVTWTERGQQRSFSIVTQRAFERDV